MREFTLALQPGQASFIPAQSSRDRIAWVNSECQRIRSVWTGLLFSRAKDYMVKRYVWFQQQSLLELADEVFLITQQQESSPGSESVEIILKQLLGQLLELNNFLVHYFFSYFNQNSRIPQAWLPVAREKMRHQAQELRSLLEKAGVDEQLKTCIRNYLEPIVQADARAVLSYRAWEYLTQLNDSLCILLTLENEQELTDRVSEILFCLNFNQWCFFWWCQERIRQGLRQLENLKDRLTYLMEKLSFSQTAPVRLTMSYEPEVPPINLLLEKWLLKEIYKESEADIKISGKESKMPLNLSVAHLGLLIRLFYDEGLFGLKNVSQVLRFFSRHFTSKKQDQISPDSLRKSFYSEDKFAASILKDLFTKMLKRIHSLFFPE